MDADKPRGIFSTERITRADLDGLRVTVMGLGLFGGGRGLTDFLCRAGAIVTVTDLRDAETLRPSMTPLAHHEIEWVLGHHREVDFEKADLVFVNPAVPRDAALVRHAVRRGVPLETEMNLFFKLCPGKICGVTGSNGKTTTTSLIGAMLGRAQPRTRLGGNLGASLLGELDEIERDDWIVLELSSFQLEDLADLERRPEISLVTNLSPNHLNRHGDYASYIEAKRRILDGEGMAVLNENDSVLRSWGRETDREVVYYGEGAHALPREAGVWLVGDDVVHCAAGDSRRLFGRDDCPLPGDFNLVNAAGAAAAALLAGATPDATREGLRSFRPIEHRLEHVGRFANIDWYNDSIATTPESTLCAIEALGPNLVVIAGGSDKGAAFEELGDAIALRTRGVVAFGQTAPKILEAVRLAGGETPAVHAADLDEAVREACALARPGDRIALSPACASYDMFTHFAERGLRFKKLVRSLAPVRS